MSSSRVRFGVIGIHGFSRHHIQSILEIADKDPGVQLVAASAYQRELDPAFAAGLEARGVRLVDRVEDLLALGTAHIDVICVPTGIALHVPFSIQALEAGYAVLVEKPVAGTIQEVDALMAARDRAGRPVLVGYQWMYHNLTRQVKRALCDGLLGDIREVRGFAAWPRYKSYYDRNEWAGRLRVGNAWVLDSPFNNACAHYLQLALFFANSQSLGTADPLRVQAELYRAKPIENADTACIAVDTAQGARVYFSVTHATPETFGPEFTLIGTKGTAVFRVDPPELVWQGGAMALDPATAVDTPFTGMVATIRGESDAPQCTLEIARPQTLAVNGAHLSSPIRPFPATLVEARTLENGDTHHCVPSLYAQMRQAWQQGCMLSDLGVEWAHTGESVDVQHLHDFTGPRELELA